jgi:hypothetical protein
MTLLGGRDQSCSARRRAAALRAARTDRRRFQKGVFQTLNPRRRPGFGFAFGRGDVLRPRSCGACGHTRSASSSASSSPASTCSRVLAVWRACRRVRRRCSGLSSAADSSPRPPGSFACESLTRPPCWSAEIHTWMPARPYSSCHADPRSARAGRKVSGDVQAPARQPAGRGGETPGRGSSAARRCFP